MYRAQHQHQVRVFSCLVRFGVVTAKAHTFSFWGLARQRHTEKWCCHPYPQHSTTVPARMLRYSLCHALFAMLDDLLREDANRASGAREAYLESGISWCFILDLHSAPFWHGLYRPYGEAQDNPLKYCAAKLYVKWQLHAAAIYRAKLSRHSTLHRWRRSRSRS